MAWTGTARIAVSALVVSGAHLAGSGARADAVTEWNVIALNATAVPPNSVLQSRALAIVHAAIYDAARAIDQKSPAYAVDLKASPGVSVDAAIAAAAHGVLVRLAPLQRPVLDDALNATLSKIAEGLGKSGGIDIGTQVAEKLVALRSSDGADAKAAFTPKPGPALYQLTPRSGPAILVQWGT